MCTIYDWFSQPFLICSGHPSGLRLPEHWIHCCHGYQGQTWGAVSMTGLGWQLQLLSTYQLNNPFFLKIWCSYPLANQDAHPRVRASESCVQGQSAECKGSCLDLRADCSSFNPSASNPPCKPTYTDIFSIIFYLRCSIICSKKSQQSTCKISYVDNHW